MRFLFTVAITACFALKTIAANAQDNTDVWSLQRCVQYAVDHNISIQQDVLNKRLAKYTLLQSQLSQLPSVNATPAYGRSYGRSINPTTNQFADNSYDFAGLSGTANLVVFGWFATRNTIAKNKYSLQASQADLDQLKDDVSLNVATGYLRALQAQEQINISQKQVALSMAQLDQTRSFTNSGRLPELNVAQLESQVATDSSSLITAIANYTAAILDLKTLLNLDFDAPFTILAPDVKVSDQVSVSNMKPEDIFAEAKKHFGSIRSSELKVTAAEKGVSAAKGALYPQLNIAAQFGTNWASNYDQVTGAIPAGLAPIGFTKAADTVYQPAYTPILSPIPFGKQLNNNFRQTYQISLNIPIFNGWQGQYAVRQAKYNLATQQLNEYQAELTLKQDVYKAYNDAINSIQKYYAAVRAADAAQRALDFAKKRYDLGLTNTVDYLVTQNTQYSAESSMLSAKYDLIFKLKVIDYYLGKELKL